MRVKLQNMRPGDGSGESARNKVVHILSRGGNYTERVTSYFPEAEAKQHPAVYSRWDCEVVVCQAAVQVRSFEVSCSRRFLGLLSPCTVSLIPPALSRPCQTQRHPPRPTSLPRHPSGQRSFFSATRASARPASSPGTPMLPHPWFLLRTHPALWTRVLLVAFFG